MEFRLLFKGELLPSGNRSRPQETHAIRREFHPQLQQLWRAEASLIELAKMSCPAAHGRFPEDKLFDVGLTTIGEKWHSAGFDFVPLVTEKLKVRCSIDILLLRPEIEQKHIFRRGDIDGQVKTLFDAFRIAANEDETGGATPQEGETPFFCLLEDDRLITEVRVTTDRLLLLPEQKEPRPNDCFAVIQVKLNHNPPRTFDSFF